MVFRRDFITQMFIKKKKISTIEASITIYILQSSQKNQIGYEILQNLLILFYILVNITTLFKMLNIIYLCESLELFNYSYWRSSNMYIIYSNFNMKFLKIYENYNR